MYIYLYTRYIYKSITEGYAIKLYVLANVSTLGNEG